MDFSVGDPRKSIADWDEDDVQTFFARLGYPQYEAQIREHNISGDVLCILDADSLKEIGVATIGQRLAILKAVYMVKLAHNIPIEADHYVPPSEAEENVTLDKLYDLVKQQADRLYSLEEENGRLRHSIISCMDDIRSSQLRPSEDSPIRRDASFNWSQYKAQSPTKPVLVDSPHPSPNRTEHDLSSRGSGNTLVSASSSNTLVSQHSPTEQQQRTPTITTTNGLAPPSSKPTRQDSGDNLKSFKVSLDDPAWKVLPAALKKYKINNDDWQNYAMFICYGSTGNRIERCLSYDEKPLLLFQKLKDAKKNPVFMLKHIKDIRSPIAVAQQKHAARQASEPALPGQTKSSAASIKSSRSPKLHVNDTTTNGTAPPMTAIAPQSGWPDTASNAENKDRSNESGVPPSAPAEIVKLQASSGSRGQDESGGHREMITSTVTNTGLSYAVAIYPYMAEQEDEFDVVVGDTFIILSRARGWWVVQRDPAGTGAVEPETSKQGWVPAGCLLETSIPVASAVAEATGTKGIAGSTPPLSPSAKKTPILPLSIVSTSFPGIALMDYKGRGEEELDLVKDDALRVFKRYNHWSYAVKEDGGDRGWVPSWYIGKVAASSGGPATPNTSLGPNPLTGGSISLDPERDMSALQQAVSPMSSAFPPPKGSMIV
ncbi:hypothetical protein JAAARDRAFT_31030 [Jaapia argillacea MUCL 33604]|uniref:Protein kinase regulator n=1 Tax=Jaapia argillacea MUCL 33604 TaxID=933084 RepID=A0A067Q3D3_9AGAM|nr:hypothetical protein JAAARDRAFT_31030 [Jaapia argillacea MUCL 33604]